jgi:hypothetical protein
MPKIDLIYRILAFLVFATITIFISSYYVKKIKKKSLTYTEIHEQDENETPDNEPN